MVIKEDDTWEQQNGVAMANNYYDVPSSPLSALACPRSKWGLRNVELRC